ncbi:MAG: P1 family peptidase [Faecalibacterium sp.]
MSEQKRIADYGYQIGEFPKGKRNKITDVAGVTVGHWTHHSDTQHTGVTVIVPHEGNVYLKKPVAASYVLNGYGKTAGLMQVEELGYLETPIALTGTLNVGLVQDALVEYTLAQCEKDGLQIRSINPLVGECNDGTLGNNHRRLVGRQEVFAALASASAEFAEGDVGAGSGMICHELKGGIGSASRVVTFGEAQYTIGVLVQANHGQLPDLQIAGNPIGKEIAAKLQDPTPREREQGSCMMILATDLPLSDRQLRRVIKRMGAGLVRNGSRLGHGSGDVCVGFTTANCVLEKDNVPFSIQTILQENLIDTAFRATVEACEEAVLNAMVCAQTVQGADGKCYYSLAHFL